MASNVEAIEAAILEATAPGFRAQLLTRGEARSMIWREGELPAGSPEFDSALSYDLLSYGYSLLSMSLRLLEEGGRGTVARLGFENAAGALESIVRNGPSVPDASFHRIVMAAAYHLGGFSARAYSMLTELGASSSMLTIERCLVLLMRRDLDTLEVLLQGERGQTDSDDFLMQRLQRLFDDDEAVDPERLLEVVDAALTDSFLMALKIIILAFERGEASLISAGLSRFETGLSAASELQLVRQWWVHRLAIHLIRGLWDASFHVVLPKSPTDPNNLEWGELRANFIASMFRRKRSEIELWPSQLGAAERVLDTHDNLVLSLPTSAGKTRIAELCALATLSENRRVVFITPLRALSAQTETTLARTFAPLGKSVTSLYGSTGFNSVDRLLLETRDITVATPEKLDFALRNDPGLLDDVGLIILDEGHMIGLGEREVRYEAQVQRLLRRQDAATRRIVCLSAVLPDAHEAEDFVGWLTDDNPEGLISDAWRPTKLRFGEVSWNKDHARLDMIVGDQEPYIPKFFEAFVPPYGSRKRPFPADQQEMVLATAWQLVEDEETVLIYCPTQASVNALAKKIADLYKRGALRNVLEGDTEDLQAARSVGEEWFGQDHNVLFCLSIGVAIHHGSMPAPYRREVERLLQKGTLKVTISSPTLAQGLNLSASALVVQSLWRNRETLKTSEFRNIVGRAGRAFIDSVGLIVHPIFDNHVKRRREWRGLVEDTSQRDMESGIVQLVFNLLHRMWLKLGTSDFQSLIDYVAGNGAWEWSQLPGESSDQAEDSLWAWRWQLSSLDTAILSTLTDSTIAEDNIEMLLDEALESSLWARSIRRKPEDLQLQLQTALKARARFVWSKTTPVQRNIYAMSGIGLETGQKLDAEAQTLQQHLQDAQVAIREVDSEQAISSIISFSAIVLKIYPFAPKSLPDDWEQIMEGWLRGEEVATMPGGAKTTTLDLIERVCHYSLPWAAEAVRIRALVAEAESETSQLLAESGLVAAALESGSLDESVMLLMKAGFSSRTGAIEAVRSTQATFKNLFEFQLWLHSQTVQELSADESWPTPTSHNLWKRFVAQNNIENQSWKHHVSNVMVRWHDDYAFEAGTPLRAVVVESGETFLETAEGELAGKLDVELNPDMDGVLIVTASDREAVELSYRGPSDLFVR